MWLDFKSLVLSGIQQAGFRIKKVDLLRNKLIFLFGNRNDPDRNTVGML
jgi:hypothetical protein